MAKRQPPRARSTRCLQKTNDLAREAVGCTQPSRWTMTPHHRNCSRGGFLTKAHPKRLFDEIPLTNKTLLIFPIGKPGANGLALSHLQRAA
jgi:hypothetical protein